ncbi:META domain-containing protein [Streptomyces ficellus]
MPTTYKHHLTASAALVALVALAACGTEPGSGAGDGSTSVRPDVPLTGVHWSVDSVTADGRKTAAPAGAHVMIDAKGRATGSYGCNHFTAKASIEGDTVTLGDATATEMACGEPAQSFENTLKSALTGKLKATLADDRLTLTTPGGDTVQLSEQPPAQLTGTKWTVQSRTSGETVSSLPAGTEGKAHFVFGEDGSVRGNLGCNSFSASATTEGSTITFGRVSATRKLCPGPEMEVERALLKVMSGKATYTIEHRTLTLTAPDGTGVAANASGGATGATGGATPRSSTGTAS